MEAEIKYYQQLLLDLSNHLHKMHDRGARTGYDKEDKKVVDKFFKYKDRFYQFLGEQIPKPEGARKDGAWSGTHIHGSSWQSPNSHSTELQKQIEQLQYELSKEKAEKEKVIKLATQQVKDSLEQRKDNSTKLSQEMNSKVRFSEQSLENVSIKNRPLNVAGEYQSICTTEWLAAKDELDKKCQSMIEQQKVELLCKVFVDAVAVAEAMKGDVFNKIRALLCQPLESSATVHMDEQNTLDYVQDNLSSLKTHFLDVFRIQADTVNTQSLQQEIKKHMHSTISPDKNNAKWARELQQVLELSKSKLGEFIIVCARLAWKMVLQRPPMAFDTSGKNGKCNAQKHEVFWNSGNPSKGYSILQYYVHPILVQDQTVMVKGTVFLRH